MNKFCSLTFLTEESPLKIPKVTSLSSSTLASLRGTPTDGKLKPNYYSKKSKYKDDSNVQSQTLSGSTRTSLSQGHLTTSRKTSLVLSEQPIECIGYCIIICGTLVHHEPAITAPLLMDIIETIGRVAASHRYAWQENSTVVALANSTNEKSLHTVALSWNDFPEFNSIIAPKWLPNDINEQKCLSLDISTTLLSNIAQFMEYISIDSPIQLCTSVFLEFDFLFDKLTRIYTTIKSSTPINYANVRRVFNPFSKLLTFILQNETFQLEHIIQLCSIIITNGTERMKHYLNETVAFVADIHTITKIKVTKKDFKKNNLFF
ncbi:unnamed protein product [Rotaria sp. Silwood1]|nr:unnamed protein product [Rotaria sp. Silwood1]